MKSKPTSGFHDLVMFLARPKTVVVGVFIAFVGGYVFASNAFALLVLLPIGGAVALVLLELFMGIVPRIMALIIYPEYRAETLNSIRALWKGK